MKTKLMNTILAAFLLTAGTFTSPAFADDTSVDKQQANEKPLETWPSSAKPEGPTPGICASFLDPDFRLIERDDEAKGEKKDAGKKEKADKDEKNDKDKKETKQKKRRANAYTNPESTSCVV